MSEPRTIELIQLGLDDAIAPAERLELERRLASDPGATSMRDELAALSTMLAETPVAEPPAGLVADVMAQVRMASANAPAPFVDRRGARGRKRTLAMRVALGVAAALAIGFVLSPSLRQSIDPSHARGTMIEQPGGAAAATEIPIRAASFAGTIRVTQEARRVTLDIELDSATPRQIRVTYDPAVLAPGAMPGGATVSVGSNGAATLEFAVAGATTRLEFTRKFSPASKVELSIRQGGEAFATTVQLEQTTNF